MWEREAWRAKYLHPPSLQGAYCLQFADGETGAQLIRAQVRLDPRSVCSLYSATESTDISKGLRTQNREESPAGPSGVSR